MNVDEYGIDWEGPVPTEVDDDNIVEIPETNFPLTPQQHAVLFESVDALRPSEYHGVDIYLDTLTFLTSSL